MVYAYEKKVLAMALKGHSLAFIARETGCQRPTVFRWLRAIGWNTSVNGEANLPCPACEGKMKKQEVFYWKCECGAEWWPPDDLVPDNPEEWNFVLRPGIDEEALIIIKKMLEEGKKKTEIVEVLNNAGFKTEKGHTWTWKNLSKFCSRKNLFNYSFKNDRKEALEIIKTMILKGYSCNKIADYLNAKGLKRANGQPYDRVNVFKAVSNNLKLRAPREGLVAHVNLPERMKSKIHPWKRDESVRYVKVRRKCALSIMSRKDDKG